MARASPFWLLALDHTLFSCPDIRIGSRTTPLIASRHLSSTSNTMTWYLKLDMGHFPFGFLTNVMFNISSLVLSSRLTLGVLFRSWYVSFCCAETVFLTYVFQLAFPDPYLLVPIFQAPRPLALSNSTTRHHATPFSEILDLPVIGLVSAYARILQFQPIIFAY